MQIVLVAQNLHRDLVPWLRDRHKDWIVHHETDLDLATEEDPLIADWLIEYDALIITLNHYFADQRRFPPGRLPGVVRLRVFPTTFRVVTDELERLPSRLHDEELAGAVTIVDMTKICQLR